MIEFATTSEVAEVLGVSVPRIHALISQERIIGARKVGSKRGTWLIPVDKEGKPKILPSRERPRAFKKIQIA